MDLRVHLTLIVTLVITLELDQVLQSVVTHVAVQDSLDLILFLTIDESWGWGWCRWSARDGIRKRRRQFDHREDSDDPNTKQTLEYIQSMCNAR
jgi:hypothetical protein